MTLYIFLTNQKQAKNPIVPLKENNKFKISKLYNFLTILNQKKEILKKLTHSNFNLF